MPSPRRRLPAANCQTQPVRAAISGWSRPAFWLRGRLADRPLFLTHRARSVESPARRPAYARYPPTPFIVAINGEYTVHTNT
jgi:hypothetical protein